MFTVLLIDRRKNVCTNRVFCHEEIQFFNAVSHNLFQYTSLLEHAKDHSHSLRHVRHTYKLESCIVTNSYNVHVCRSSEDRKRDLCDDRLKCIKAQLRERAPKYNRPAVPPWSLEPWNRCWRQLEPPSFTILNVVDFFRHLYGTAEYRAVNIGKKIWASRNRVAPCQHATLPLSRSIRINRSGYRYTTTDTELPKGRFDLAKCGMNRRRMDFTAWGTLRRLNFQPQT